MPLNVADGLAAAAARHAERPAVTDVRTGRSLSYGQLTRETARVSAFLRAQGVEPGHRIGLLAPNGLAYWPAAFGLLAAGACLVPLATHLTPTEIADVLRAVEVNGCLAWPSADPRPGGEPAATLAGGVAAGFTFAWRDRAAPGPAGFRAVNPAFIRFTSGTTARSKGVVLSHEATLARVVAADRVLRLGPADRIAWVLPLAYHFAVTIVAYARAGAHVLLCADTLPTALLDALRRLAPTVLYASPLHFERLAGLPGGAPLSSVRICLSTSAPLAAAVGERFRSVHGVAVGQAYGLIEAGLPCINLGSEGGPPATSVGRAVPGYEVAVLSERAEPVPPGTSGEIGVRGDGLFDAYYAPWQRRTDLMRNGWFLTGDVGRLDQEGALTLIGRQKAVIFVAGLKFFPEEVEACLDGFPGVRESRVFGRPHRHLGEVPCAEVAPTAPGAVDLDALRAHCAERLSPYKVPAEFRIVEAVARTPGGKLLRRPAPSDTAGVPAERA